VIKGGYLLSPDAKKRRRANRKFGKSEWDRRNAFGNKDLTPYNAQRAIKGKTIIY
jgi:hypothetical protein